MMVSTDFIKNLPLFNGLTEYEASTIAKSSAIENISKHKKVYKLNDDIRYIYVVLKGSVKLGVKTADEKHFVKYLVYKNEVFGENIFSSITQRSEDAVTLTDSEILMVDVSVIKSLINNNSTLMATLANIIIKRINELEERMQSFVFLTAKERITAFLKKTASIQGISIGVSETLINHGMSHKEIAYITDTSRQTVAKILNELKDLNIIHFTERKPGKILIRDLAML
jgi:CRP-like cAMP-binding protein